MDTYKLKFTRLQNEIFRFLCMKAGIKWNQRGLAKMLKVSPTAIAKALPLLDKEELIKFEKGDNINLNFVSFNRDSEKAIFFKKTENLRMLYEIGFVQFIYNTLPGSTAVLFGSYSKGEDTAQSDIDIAVIGYKDKNLDLKEFEEKLGHVININYYENWKDINKHLKNNILNGITLAGAVEL
jgi:predicted nucleotidyltransferase